MGGLDIRSKRVGDDARRGSPSAGSAAPAFARGSLRQRQASLFYVISNRHRRWQSRRGYQL